VFARVSVDSTRSYGIGRAECRIVNDSTGAPVYHVAVLLSTPGEPPVRLTELGLDGYFAASDASAGGPPARIEPGRSYSLSIDFNDDGSPEGIAAVQSRFASRVIVPARGSTQPPNFTVSWEPLGDNSETRTFVELLPLDRIGGIAASSTAGGTSVPFYDVPA